MVHDTEHISFTQALTSHCFSTMPKLAKLRVKYVNFDTCGRVVLALVSIHFTYMSIGVKNQMRASVETEQYKDFDVMLNLSGKQGRRKRSEGNCCCG